MNSMTEDALFQQTTTDYLHDKLGWDVYAYNNETFGLYGTLGRKNDNEVVLTRYLKTALVKFNKDLPQQAYDDAVRQIVEYPATQSVLQINQDKYSLLKDGVLVQFRDEKGDLIKRRLKVFDFEHPEKNNFLADSSQYKHFLEWKRLEEKNRAWLTWKPCSKEYVTNIISWICSRTSSYLMTARANQ